MKLCTKKFTDLYNGKIILTILLLPILSKLIYHSVGDFICVTNDKRTAAITSYIGSAPGTPKFHRHTSESHIINLVIFGPIP